MKLLFWRDRFYLFFLEGGIDDMLLSSLMEMDPSKVFVPLWRHRLATVTRELLREHGRRSNLNVARNWRQIVPRPLDLFFFFLNLISKNLADYQSLFWGGWQCLLKMGTRTFFFWDNIVGQHTQPIIPGQTGWPSLRTAWLTAGILGTCFALWRSKMAISC